VEAQQTITAEIVGKVLVPKLRAQQARNKEIKELMDLEKNQIHLPKRSSAEHVKLAEYARTPWGPIIIRGRVNRLKVAGIRDGNVSSTSLWGKWKAWGAVTKEKIAYGEANTYGEAYIEERLVGVGKTVLINKSPHRFAGFYSTDGIGDPYGSAYPLVAIEEIEQGKVYKVWDANYVSVWEQTVGSFGETNYSLVKQELHGAPCVPMVRYAVDMNSDGAAVGAIYPLRHMIRRITKTALDQITVNHSNSWNVRTVAGLSQMSNADRFADETDEEFDKRRARMEEGLRLEMSQDTLLTSPDKDTKFGSLPATNPGSFVTVVESEIRQLSAASNTPSSYLTGDAGLAVSAEQASNANDTFLSMIEEQKDLFGEAHEALFALDALMTGGTFDPATVSIAWWDRDNGSIAAKVDALGKAATMLKIPVQSLWERFPNVTPEELDNWKKAAEVEAAKESAFTNALMTMGNETQSPVVLAKDNNLGE
jgi:hypothetical protein